MKTLQSYYDTLSKATAHNDANIQAVAATQNHESMQNIAAKLNAIEPSAGEGAILASETLPAASIMPLVAIAGMFLFGAALLSQGISAHFAFKRAKTRFM
ncbi:MAG: hypothetical protein ACRBCT_03040 [Alphaproteobacteria bacterium]